MLTKTLRCIFEIIPLETFWQNYCNYICLTKLHWLIYACVSCPLERLQTKYTCHFFFNYFSCVSCVIHTRIFDTCMFMLIGNSKKLEFDEAHCAI